MKVRFAKTVQISFQSAIQFIHQNNPTAALKFFFDRFVKTLRRIEKHPDSGCMIPEFPQLPYCEILVLPYRFFYRINGKTVFVVAVWHTAQIPIEPIK